MSLENAKTFYRKMYYQCTDFIENDMFHYIAFLTGPRKIGKSFCFLQLQQEYNAIYINFENIKFWSEVANQIIQAPAEALFLLDECTEIEGPLEFFNTIEQAFVARIDSPKILVTGSQATALTRLKDKSFSSKAIQIRSGFIDYEEWLQFRGECIPTPENYMDYICYHSSFAGIGDNLSYIRSCIEETISSELKSDYNMHGIAVDVDPNIANWIFYTSLVSLHDQPSLKKLWDYPKMLHRIYCANMRVKQEDLHECIDTIITPKLQKLSSVNMEDFKVALLFLLQQDFITINEPVSVRPEYSTDNVVYWLQGKNSVYDYINTPSKFFTTFNVCVKYPLFYTNILYEIRLYLNTHKGYDLSIEELVSPTTLSNIVECHVRGLYSYIANSNALFIFNDGKGKVDVYDMYSFNLIEVSIGNKSNTRLHFDQVPDHNLYHKTLITRDTNEKGGDKQGKLP